MSRVMGRVVFYSASDLSTGVHLQDAEIILRSFDVEAQRDINDVLELYSIKKYLDADCALRVMRRNRFITMLITDAAMLLNNSLEPLARMRKNRTEDMFLRV